MPFRRDPPPFTAKPSAAQRRREQLEDEVDRRTHQRPNDPPRPSPYTLCHDSVYLTHRFIPDPKTGRRCAFCRRPEEQCLLPGEQP